MKNSISLLISIVFCLLSVPVLSQDIKTISAKKQQKDWKQLKHLIEAHPDPYRHYSEAEVNQFIDDKISSAKDGKDQLVFFKEICEAIALLKDGHTSVAMSENFEKKMLDDYGLCPLKIYINNDDEMYMVDRYDGLDNIPKGSKIVSINGVATKEFIQGIDPYISYERVPFRNVIIELRFNTYLQFYFGRKKSHEIEYASVKSETVSIDNMPYKAYKSAVKLKRDEREKQMIKGRPYAFEIVNEQTALIKIFSFSVQSLEKYEFFLDKTFKEIQEKNIQYLIIDVRGNFGGWPKVSSELFHRITQQYFKTKAASKMKVSEAYRDYFRANYTGISHAMVGTHYSNSTHSLDITAIMKEKIGTMVTETEAYNELPKEKLYEFSGNVFLLTDRNSYSAASNFAATFKCYQLGTIIGSETGGTGIFHANAFRENLGASQTRVFMASTKVYATCYDQPDDGIKPHIAFEPSTIDIINGFDSQLNYALRIIKKIEKEKEK